MSELVKRLWLGVTLIAATSAFLLLSATPGKARGQRDSARRDPAIQLHAGAGRWRARPDVDYLKQHGYDGTHKVIIEHFNAENDVQLHVERNRQGNHLGQLRIRDFDFDELPAGGGECESRGQGETPVRHRGRPGGGEGGRGPERIPREEAEAHDRHRQRWMPIDEIMETARAR